jgi:mRNA-degrading endonuclease toxin of MazEF toxin-antitoxin module
VKPGSIVVVDWRDALPESGEPNKQRPAIVVGSDRIYDEAMEYLLVVPITGDARLSLIGATMEIEPAEANRCIKRSYALAWNVQTVPKRRVRETDATVTDGQLDELRDQIARLVER